MTTTKRPRTEETSRDDLMLEDMKSLMMKYCIISKDTDDTADIHKFLMDFKKNTEDMKSMSEDLVCKQRQAYDELTQALQKMTQIAAKDSSGNQASFSDEDFEHAVKLAEEQKVEIDELKREKRDVEVELEQLKEIQILNKQKEELGNHLHSRWIQKTDDIVSLNKEKSDLESYLKVLCKEKEQLQSDVELLHIEKAKVGNDLDDLLEKTKCGLQCRFKVLVKETTKQRNDIAIMNSKRTTLEKDIELLDNDKEKIVSEIELLNIAKDTIASDVELLNKEKLMLSSEKTRDETAKQALGLEIERLRGNLNVLKHMGGDDQDEAFNKMDEMSKNLEEKEGELEILEVLNQALVVKERKSNDELQEARKELISGLRDIMSVRAQIGVKRMGELDSKPFHEACKRKLKENNQTRSGRIGCSL